MKNVLKGGLGVALATPFIPSSISFDSLGIDIPAFRAHVQRQIAGGVDFLVVLGSTGEAATVQKDERTELIKVCLQEAKGRPVIVGTGHNDTKQAVAQSQEAAALGADGILVVTPYYNKPQLAGLYQHYKRIADCGLPIIVYNVPGRTGSNITAKDLDTLWTIPEIIAVKESSGNLAQIGEIARCLPNGKLLFSGDDALALPTIALGGCGVISVSANLVPRMHKDMIDAALRGNFNHARKIHTTLLPLMDALFLESNPCPLKAAMALAGFCSPALRLPLAPVSQKILTVLRELLPKYNLSIKEN